jgi:hypothetical protein
MKLLLSLWPAWKESSRRRAELQGEPKNRARSEFSEAVIQLERRANAVTRTAEDVLRFMHHKGGGN